MIKIMWLFRTNLLPLEYYHQYKDLKTFKEKCHDFYLLQGIWFLENTELETFIVWRLKPKNSNLHNNIIFDVNGKKFKQIFVESFDECIKWKIPDIAFFRGGFKEYDDLVLKYQRFFQHTLTLYLGASKRILPQYGGIYKHILIENEKDKYINKSIPFYKTANSNIFKNLNYSNRVIDILWICNNTQHRMKGQKYFVEQLKNNNYLKKLRIGHIGNKPEYLQNMFDKYCITNVKLYGYKTRQEINKLLNMSKIGLVTSDEGDGNPRVLTEILQAGTLLLFRSKTNMLDYYKDVSFSFEDDELKDKVKIILKKYEKYYKKLNNQLSEGFCSMDEICKKNITLWQKN